MQVMDGWMDVVIKKDVIHEASEQRKCNLHEDVDCEQCQFSIINKSGTA
jgi:hypothetical protein